MLEMVLLKPFHPSCDLMESVNGWCLFDSADSQGDGDKSPEPRGENTENQSLLENFDVFDFFSVEAPHPCGKVANKTKSRLLF